jgi:hypothetical protein
VLKLVQRCVDSWRTEVVVVEGEMRCTGEGMKKKRVGKSLACRAKSALIMPDIQLPGLPMLGRQPIGKRRNDVTSASVVTLDYRYPAGRAHHRFHDGSRSL